MALKVKLVRALAGHSHDQKEAVVGLGLGKLGSERILNDTPAIRGMVAKVAHLVSMEEVKGQAPTRGRRAGKKKASASKEA